MDLTIGRELYTAPFIWVAKDKLDNHERKSDGKGWTSRDKFSVSKMEVKDGAITMLVIKNDSTGKEAYSYGKKTKSEIKDESKAIVEDLTKPKKIKPMEALTLQHMCESDSIRVEYITESYKIKSIEDLSPEQYEQVVRNWEVIKSKPNAHTSEDK